MVMRNGFIRTLHGDWINLNKIVYFGLHIYGEYDAALDDDLLKRVVTAYLEKDGGRDCGTEELSKPFDTYEEARDFMDELFGFKEEVRDEHSGLEEEAGIQPADG